MSPIATFGRFLLRVLGFAVAVVLAVAGLVLMSGVLLLVAALGLGLYLWLRWRGRGAGPVRFVWRRASARTRAHHPHGTRRPGRTADVEVVDVSYHEIASTDGASSEPEDAPRSRLPPRP
jgi:hypothetical protein